MSSKSDSSLTIGRIAGAPVRIGPGSVLVAAYIAYMLGTEWSGSAGTPFVIIVSILTGVGFLASILAHEAGHAIVAKRAGIGSYEIRLSMLGGAAALERGAPDPATEMKVAAAGPAVNLGIAAVCLGAAYSASSAGSDSIVIEALAWIGVINVIVGVFNLLPGLPLDGGRVLTGFLWWRRNDRGAAVRTTAKVGRVLGYLAFAVAGFEFFVLRSFFGIYTAFIGMVLMRGADAELAQSRLVEMVRGRTVSDIARFEPPMVDEETNTASARALLPSPPANRWAVVRDRDGVARGLLDLVLLDRAANVDGTDLVSGVMLPIDERRAAFRAETLENVINRGVLTPFVVIDEQWQPVALVENMNGVLPTTA